MPTSKQRVLRDIALGIFIPSLKLRQALLSISRCRKRWGLPIPKLLWQFEMLIPRPPRVQPIKDTYGSLRRLLCFVVRRKIEWSLIVPVSGVAGGSINSNFSLMGSLFPSVVLVICHLALNFFLITIVLPLWNEWRTVEESIFLGYI